MKKILDADWLRAVQFQGNEVRRNGVGSIELPFLPTILVTFTSSYVVQNHK